MPRLWSPRSKNGLALSIPGSRFLFFLARSSFGSQDITSSSKYNFFVDFENTSPLVCRFLRGEGLRTSGHHRSNGAAVFLNVNEAQEMLRALEAAIARARPKNARSCALGYSFLCTINIIEYAHNRTNRFNSRRLFVPSLLDKIRSIARR